MLGHMLYKCSTLQNNTKLFSKAVISYYIPTRNVKEISHIHSLQHLVFSGYLNFTNPVDVKWHPIVFPICISLSKSEVVYIFMCIRHICFLFSEMPSPTFSLYFSIGIFFSSHLQNFFIYSYTKTFFGSICYKYIPFSPGCNLSFSLVCSIY